jgi:two-component system cell cycle response regulator DivK
MNKILIAEDNPVNLELLREILSPLQYEVVEANNGREALARLAEAEPDLILLDINMPILDGFAAIREIRQHAQFKHLPVLAITAYAMKDDRERILAAGFDSYISKPINPALLLGELERLMGDQKRKTSA